MKMTEKIIQIYTYGDKKPEPNAVCMVKLGENEWIQAKFHSSPEWWDRGGQMINCFDDDKWFELPEVLK